MIIPIKPKNSLTALINIFWNEINHLILLHSKEIRLYTMQIRWVGVMDKSLRH
jgi:hypothetical protein